MFEVRITSDARLRAASARLKAAGRGGARTELLRGLRASAKPLIPNLKESAMSTLPKRGGLAADIAGSSFSVRTKGGLNLGVRIVASNADRVDRIDKGTVRHPVYGRGGWVTQSVTPGWFTKPMEQAEPQVRAEIQKAILRIAKTVEG